MPLFCFMNYIDSYMELNQRKAQATEQLHTVNYIHVWSRHK